MDLSFSKQHRRINRRSRLPAEPRSPAIGTIPVDPSDDAGDGGGNSTGVSPASRTTDPNSHTPVSARLAAVRRSNYLRPREIAAAVDMWITRCREFTHIPTAQQPPKFPQKSDGRPRAEQASDLCSSEYRSSGRTRDLANIPPPWNSKAIGDRRKIVALTSPEAPVRRQELLTETKPPTRAKSPGEAASANEPGLTADARAFSHSQKRARRATRPVT